MAPILLSSSSASAQSENIDPAYLAAMRQQSLAADAIGDFKLRIGDTVGARSAYLEGLELARRLFAAQPANTQCQADIIVSLWKLAAATRDQSTKISTLREALSFVAKLEVQGALKSNQRSWRTMIEAEITKPSVEDHPASPQRQRKSTTTTGFLGRQH